jgi:hypothetical protein
MNEVTYPVQERTRYIHGVSGQALPVHEPVQIRGRRVHLNQTWVARRLLADGRSVRVTLRFDDECKNGHQTFSITGEERRADGSEGSCGCIHELIAEAFPELAHLIKWHGVTTDGPLHYVANTVYHAGDRDHWGKARDLAAARSVAVWPEATDEELCAEPAVLREALERRLPALLAAFRADVEACGFLWEPEQ